MSQSRRMGGILALLVFTVALCRAAEPAGNPQLSKERFNTIATNLDTGGDLMIVANVEGYLEGLIQDVMQLILAAPGKGPDAEAGRQLLAKIPGFLKKNGFYAVRGLGASVVPRTNGLNSVKAFIDRDPAAAALPLWRGLFGDPSQSVKSTAFLPADTVLVRSGNGNLGELWKLVRTGVTELASPAAAANFNRNLSNLSTNMGVNLDKVFASMDGDGFVSIQLSKTATIALPTGTTAPVKIPQPSLLICLAVKDDTLVKAIQAPLNRIKMPTVQNQQGSVVISTINFPMPIPFPLEPSFTICSNFFLFGTTAQVVNDAVKAFNQKDGLVATAEFKKAMEGLPAQNNGLLYINRRLSKVLTDLQVTLVGNTGVDAPTTVLRDFLARRGEVESAFVFQNLNGGIRIVGASSTGGKELIGGLMAAPVALMAGIAIPSFVKARSTSQRNACINNLRQIDSGKEQAALANRWQDGQEVDIPAVNEYIKGGKTPVCPQGGTYTYGPLGANPTCSFPGHAMPQY